MKLHTRVAVVTLAAGLAACGERPAAPQAIVAPTEAAAPAQITEDNQGVLTDTQRAGLNSANQVSNLLNNANEERRKQLEAAENR